MRAIKLAVILRKKDLFLQMVRISYKIMLIMMSIISVIGHRSAKTRRLKLKKKKKRATLVTSNNSYMRNTPLVTIIILSFAVCHERSMLPYTLRYVCIYVVIFF